MGLFRFDTLERAPFQFYFAEPFSADCANFQAVIRISKKGDYAVFLMGYLAQHGPSGEDAVISAQEIADRSGIAKSVVANLLKDLTRAGLLESTRGIRGGYRLAQRAEDISLGQILEVVEGPFVLVDCAAPIDDAQHQCGLVSFCPSKSPMRVLHGRIAELMHALKLPELIGQPACSSTDAGRSSTTLDQFAP